MENCDSNLLIRCVCVLKQFILCKHCTEGYTFNQVIFDTLSKQNNKPWRKKGCFYFWKERVFLANFEIQTCQTLQLALFYLLWFSQTAVFHNLKKSNSNRTIEVGVIFKGINSFFA